MQISIDMIRVMDIDFRRNDNFQIKNDIIQSNMYISKFKLLAVEQALITQL